MNSQQEQQRSTRPFVTFWVVHIKPGNAEEICKNYATVTRKSRLEPGLISVQWHIPFDVQVTCVEKLTRIPLMLRTEWESSQYHDNWVFRRPYLAESAASTEPLLEAHFFTMWEQTSPAQEIDDHKRELMKSILLSLLPKELASPNTE